MGRHAGHRASASAVVQVPKNIMSRLSLTRLVAGGRRVGCPLICNLATRSVQKSLPISGRSFAAASQPES